MIERTLSIIKPDGVSRGLVGAVIGRLEEEGLKIVAHENDPHDKTTGQRLL